MNQESQNFTYKSEKNEPSSAFEMVTVEEGRWELEYPTEWSTVRSELARQVITTRHSNPEYYIQRISTLLPGLKFNPDKIAKEVRIADAIEDLIENSRINSDMKRAA